MPQKMSSYRWTVCALVFFATTINYLDRQVISLVVDDYLNPEFHWTESDYSNITVAFQFFYAIAMFFAGRLIDRLGTKIGYALSLVLWSVAAMGHALIRTTNGFIVARAALGVTESGNFPSAIKAVAEWFPKKERALATGIFNAGTNVGAIIAPLTVPLIASAWGWRMAFFITGAIGLVWLIFWFIFYEVPRKHKKISREEFDHIHSDQDKENISASPSKQAGWGQILQFRQTWAFVLGKFLTDGVWWFYLFWLPKFLKAGYGLTKEQLSLPIALVYIIAAFGSVIGGWIPLQFVKAGWTVFRARKTSMFLYACCALPVLAALTAGTFNMWYAILIIGFAAAAHQAWSANIFTTVSDMFPKEAVGAVTGVGGMAGGLGGIFIAKIAGWLFDYYKALGEIQHGYMLVFIYCGLAYLIAWLVMHLLVPRMKAVDF